MISNYFFNATADFYAPTTAKSAGGAIAPTYSTTPTYASVPCGLQPETSNATLQYRMERNVQLGTLFVRPTTPAGTAISVKAHDHIVVGGVTWKATGPSMSATAGRGHLLRVPVETPL